MDHLVLLRQIEPMSFKSFDTILRPDSRFVDAYVVQDGVTRRMALMDHHETLAEIKLTSVVPSDVQMAFDRARNILIYAFFDYDLFVVGEIQVFGAFELALKHRLNGHSGPTRGTLRNLVDRARKAAILPPLVPSGQVIADPIEALIALRNGLSHGNSEIHSPGMAFEIVATCAHWIDSVFQPAS